MKIGFDFDGTITKNPAVFKVLIDALQISHHDVYLISGTVQSERDKVIEELREYDISFSSNNIILKPEVGSLEEVTNWKFEMIDRLKIRCFFENRTETAKKINEICSTMVIQ